MKLNDYLQVWVNGLAPERVDLAPSEQRPRPWTPDPEARPGIFGNLTDWGRMQDAFTANNNVVAAAADWIGLTHALQQMPEDPNFDVFRDYDMKGVESFAYQLGWAKSREQADEIRRRLIDDMAARRRFSELDPLTQLVVGSIAATGPTDLLPLGAGRGILAAGLLVGTAVGAQSGIRESIALKPGHWENVALDASMGFLFGAGYNAAIRMLAPEHSAHLDGIGRSQAAEAAEPAQARSAGPLRSNEPAPIDGAMSPPGHLDPRADQIVRPGPDGGMAVPKGESIELPRIFNEEGSEIAGMKTDADHRGRDGAPPAQPFIFTESVISDGRRAYDLPRVIVEKPPPTVVGNSVLDRPFVIVERDSKQVMTDVPSASEIVSGQLDNRPFRSEGVKLMTDPVTDAVEAAAEGEAKAGAPITIQRDSSVGAQQAGSVWSDADSAVVRAGGIEKVKLTPAAANLASPNAEVREATAALVNHNLMVEGNVRGMSAGQSVEARHAALNNPRIVETVHAWWADYAAFVRESGGGAMTTGISRTLDFVGTRLANVAGGRGYKGFMQEVAAAIVDGGAHSSAAVRQAAARFKAVTDDLRRQAAEVGYWDFTYQMRIDELGSRIAAVQAGAAAGTGPAARDIANRSLAHLQQQLAEVQAEMAKSAAQGGPLPTHDRGFIPRYYRHDQLMARRDEAEALFQQRIDALGIKDPITGKPFTGKEAVEILLNIDPATNAPRPYVKPVGDQYAHSAKDRGFDWMPTKAIWSFIENDAEVLLRRYVRQMGIDIEITRRFGDPFMMREIQRLGGSGASPNEIQNLLFLRDFLKGAHAPMDPTSIVTHSVQAAKMLSNMAVLGAQTITAFTDLARPFMTEGFRRVFGHTFDLMADSYRSIRAIGLHRAEAEMLGSTGEMVLALRAQALANGNSVFAGTPAWLRGIEHAHSAFFMLNGIAPWTDVMKAWQSSITTARVMEHVRSLAAGKLGPEDTARLAQIGIDGKLAEDIVAQLDRHEVHLGRTSLPNIAAWDAGEARDVFRTAIWQATNRAIITPGAADVPRWTVEGTSWLPPQAAQIIAMYHNYGVAMHHRLVMAGLQGADRDFLAGALALVGLGYIVDLIRDDLNAVGDRQPRYKSTMERLTSSVDRSGLLGYATNVNNMVERLSFNTIGVKPFTGQARWGQGSFVAAAGGLGPVGSWAGNLFRVVNGEAHGREGWAEAQAFRRLLPLQNLFWMDGLFDQVQEAWYDPEQTRLNAEASRKKDREHRRAMRDQELQAQLREER